MFPVVAPVPNFKKENEMANMLGKARQPFCGKHCGYHTKADQAINKRADRHKANQAIREEKRPYRGSDAI